MGGLGILTAVFIDLYINNIQQGMCEEQLTYNTLAEVAWTVVLLDGNMFNVMKYLI